VSLTPRAFDLLGLALAAELALHGNRRQGVCVPRIPVRSQVWSKHCKQAPARSEKSFLH
jgi:hypothetical protein